MQKNLLNRAMKGTMHFICKDAPSSAPYRMPEYKVYGKIALGENVTIYDGSETYRGEVVYIHPRGRFFQIQTKGEVWRTSFALPTMKGEN